MKNGLLFICVLLFAVGAFAQNEQAPLQEKDINYKNWSYKGVRDGNELDLRNEAKGKRLVLVVYFAPWCHNWQHDAPTLEHLYEKYKDKGLDIVGVGEYGTVAEMQTNLEQMKITFPVVYESDNSDQREKTRHYDYRRSTGDTRKWGSPYYVILDPSKLEKKGDTLTKHTFIINGEMIMTDGEKLIRERLGLPAGEIPAGSAAKAGEIEKCEPTRKIGEIKKP